MDDGFPKINYRDFIEYYFLIRNRKGEVVNFHFNELQGAYNALLYEKYPKYQGVRENVLKGRQQGFSSLIDAYLVVDFILSGIGQAPILGGQIISHKAEEVKPLFDRANLFINSYLQKAGISRKDFLKEDNVSKSTMYLMAHSGAELFVGTAGARTLGRGGTLQNLHWSEMAFYIDTENTSATQLVVGAEQQVMDGIGKIFRESTGNMVGDPFYGEFKLGESGDSIFSSRFFEWWQTAEYTLDMPKNYEFSNREKDLMRRFNVEEKKARFNWTDNQFYWYLRKLSSSQDPREIVREYPCFPEEAFMSQGELYFDAGALIEMDNKTREPMKESEGVIYA